MPHVFLKARGSATLWQAPKRRKSCRRLGSVGLSGYMGPEAAQKKGANFAENGKLAW